MCVYCNMGDHHFRWDPPFPVKPTDPWAPYIPRPEPTVTPKDWDLARLIEFHELLRRVKELEDRLGCPCEPNKADYISVLRERIEALEKRAAGDGGSSI